MKPIGGLLGIGAETVYRWGTDLRNRAYDSGLLPARSLGATVVSVGNITVGGTGKTPVTLEIAVSLLEKGKRVAILSRGYGRDHSDRTVVVPPGITSVDGDHLRYGDEPCLFRNRLPDLPIYLAADRREAGWKAIEEGGAQILLMDDGMQHRKVARRHELIVVNGSVPFGNGHLLPRGSLRERATGIARGNVVLANLQQGEAADLDRLLDHAGAPAERIRFRYAPSRIIAPNGEMLSPKWMFGRKVAIVSAIGNPDSFEETVRSLGARIESRFIFRDHHRFGKRDISDIADAVKQENLITVTTEKDRFRFTDQDADLLGLHVIQVSVELVDGASKESFARMIETIASEDCS